jgi:hypothetical protein
MSWMNMRNLLAHGAIGLIIIDTVGRLSFSQDRFACTEVLGFSQSWQWFTGSAMLDYRENGRVPADAFLSNWQGRFEFGAAIELWSDQDFRGWEGTYRSLRTCPREKVDRVLFNISGAPRETRQWVQDIRKVIEILYKKYPNVQRIVLQPVVGAEEDKCADVRAARIHPIITAAIKEVVAESRNQKVIAGATPKVANCDHFSDKLGHLSPEGALYVHEFLLNHYSRIDGIRPD